MRCSAGAWDLCSADQSDFSGSGGRRARSGTNQAVSNCAAMIVPIEQGKVLVNGCGVPSQRRAAAVNQLLRRGGQGAVRRVSGCGSALLSHAQQLVKRAGACIRALLSLPSHPQPAACTAPAVPRNTARCNPVPSHLVAGALVVLADRQLHVLPCLVAKDGLQQEAVGACARGTVVREVRSVDQVSHTQWTPARSSRRLPKRNSGVEGGRCSHEYTELREVLMRNGSP